MPPVLSFFFNLNQILRNRIGLETSWESQAAQRHSVSQCAVVLERRQTNSVPSPLSWLRRQGSERLGEWKPGCGASASASERLPANRHPPPPAPAPRARPPEAELSPTKIIQIRTRPRRYMWAEPERRNIPFPSAERDATVSARTRPAASCSGRSPRHTATTSHPWHFFSTKNKATKEARHWLIDWAPWPVISFAFGFFGKSHELY
jgi:hypothetical protein